MMQSVSSSVTTAHFTIDPPLVQRATCPRAQMRAPYYQEFAAHQLLIAIAELDDNWDGEGACPINDKTKINAHRALNSLLLDVPVVPEITPNNNGTVSFEWKTDQGRAHLEIGLTRFSFYIKLSNERLLVGDGSATAIPQQFFLLMSALLFPAAGAQLAALTRPKR